jgi:hypothetical protein
MLRFAFYLLLGTSSLATISIAQAPQVAFDGHMAQDQGPPDIGNVAEAIRIEAARCLNKRDLDARPSTEILPKGKCPIKQGNLCFDRNYRTEVSNNCTTPLRIQVDAGKNYNSGLHLLTNDHKEIFGCLEAVEDCTGINITVLGFFPGPKPPGTPGAACLREADRCDRGMYSNCCSGLECVIAPGPQQYQGFCLPAK